MTSRRSSGSIRAESAVEPTRSENITVTWRRSAVSWGFGSAGGDSRRCRSASDRASSPDGRSIFRRCPSRDAEFLEVSDRLDGGGPTTSISFSAKRCAYSDMPSFFEPVRYLLRRWRAHDDNSSSNVLGLFQVVRVKPFGEPAVDRREEIAG